MDSAGQIRGATSIALASTRRRWEASNDRNNGGSTLGVEGEVVAPDPCHETIVAATPEQSADNEYLNLNVKLVPRQSTDLSCPQVLTNVAVDFALPDYAGSHSGVVIRAPNRQAVVVPLFDSL